MMGVGFFFHETLTKAFVGIQFIEILQVIERFGHQGPRFFYGQVGKLGIILQDILSLS